MGSRTRHAPQSWHDTLSQVRSLVPGIAALNSKALQLEERVRLVNLVASLNGRSVYFNSGATLLTNQEAEIGKTAAELREYEQLARVLGIDPALRVVGEVDGSGSEELNAALMARRAGVFRDALVAYGVTASMLLIDTSTIPSRDDLDPNKRRAVLDMTSNLPQEQ